MKSVALCYAFGAGWFCFVYGLGLRNAAIGGFISLIIEWTQAEYRYWRRRKMGL